MYLNIIELSKLSRSFFALPDLCRAPCAVNLVLMSHVFEISPLDLSIKNYVVNRSHIKDQKLLKMLKSEINVETHKKAQVFILFVTSNHQTTNLVLPDFFHDPTNFTYQTQYIITCSCGISYSLSDSVNFVVLQTEAGKQFFILVQKYQ